MRLDLSRGHYSLMLKVLDKREAEKDRKKEVEENEWKIENSLC